MAEGISNNYDVMELSKALKLISEKAQDVYINKKCIKKLAEKVMEFLMENLDDFYMYNNKFVRPLSYPYYKEVSRADWLFVLHTLNFSLWYPKGTRQWKVYDAKGYYALCNAIKRAIDEKTPMWNPQYYKKMTRSELEHIFRSNDGKTCIPLIDERLRILHEVGEVLVTKFKGTFMECIELSDYDADKLVKLLFDEFESYRDEVIYKDKKVRFLMKARALVSDIWDFFKEKPKFNLNTKKMMSTIFIDYHIPQLLLKFEVLRYSDMLVKRFESSKEPLEHGSREEIEIRGCSLFAIKELCKEVHRISQHQKEKFGLKTKAFNISVAVDNFLFGNLFAGYDNKSIKQYPLHYIKTVHY